jgi:hypothetical protein
MRGNFNPGANVSGRAIPQVGGVAEYISSRGNGSFAVGDLQQSVHFF